MNGKSGERTLLASVLLSSPGPVVVGAGLLVGRSSTQLADFIRRTAELAAIVVSWAVYRALRRQGEPDPARRHRLERAANGSVGLAMCLSGAAMLGLAAMGSGPERGNVIPGLVIAVLGVLTNGWFWLRYRTLDRREPSAILAAQSRLYRAKTLVDGCVTAALATLALAPASPATQYVDLGGSAAVSAYMVMSGIQVVRTAGIPAGRRT